MEDGVVHGQPVRLRLLAGDYDVHVLAAPQAVIGHGQKRVGVRWQIDTDHLGLLVDDMIDEARVLVREAVVILAPHVGRQQVVQRRKRQPPRDLVRDLEPLGVLVEHGVDDMDEGLVAVE